MKERVAHLLATGFYSGKSRIMPGTCGTAVCAVLIFLLEQTFPALSSVLARGISALFLFVLGIVCTDLLLRRGRYGVQGSNQKMDPQEIVIDEFAGFAVAIILLPSTPWAFFLGFLAFRLFDMSKPPPIRWFERLPGAYGIVADDIVAGIFAALLLCVLRFAGAFS